MTWDSSLPIWELSYLGNLSSIATRAMITARRDLKRAAGQSQSAHTNLVVLYYSGSSRRLHDIIGMYNTSMCDSRHTELTIDQAR